MANKKIRGKQVFINPIIYPIEEGNYHKDSSEGDFIKEILLQSQNRRLSQLMTLYQGIKVY